jgi:hypothetical protein
VEPTISSSAWICGIVREIGEGPITHLTMLVTEKHQEVEEQLERAASQDFDCC